MTSHLRLGPLGLLQRAGGASSGDSHELCQFQTAGGTILLSCSKSYRGSDAGEVRPTAVGVLGAGTKNQRLTIPAEFTQLVSELRACTYEDHTGDAVMATAIGVANIESAATARRPKKGRGLKIIRV